MRLHHLFNTPPFRIRLTTWKLQCGQNTGAPATCCCSITRRITAHSVRVRVKHELHSCHMLFQWQLLPGEITCRPSTKASLPNTKRTTSLLSTSAHLLPVDSSLTLIFLADDKTQDDGRTRKRSAVLILPGGRQEGIMAKNKDARRHSVPVRNRGRATEAARGSTVCSGESRARTATRYD